MTNFLIGQEYWVALTCNLANIPLRVKFNFPIGMAFKLEMVTLGSG